ncbi:hypothetical protein SOCE26_013540 [Sorangium cellulosum]|uniref:Kazal-like domain-containing protein n=1 Tax=Sorangium cellulosum TaxID=56 RepID=A0A2L0EKZ5_SORCE|nr:hypothetical protein [Sorangium cellulosum]AUX39959.1 hypothetical protein SOCE26_013540 [Sorangium cellulosum]
MNLPAWLEVRRIVRHHATVQGGKAPASAGIVVLTALLAACGGEDGGAEDAAPGPCGGVVCAADQYCNYPPGDCGEGGVVPGNYGVCQERPTSCDTATPREVCACDGRAYTNACEAARAGVSVAGGEACAGAAPPGTFACGSYFCKADAEYCQTVEDPNAKPFRLPPRNTCEQLTVACAAEPTCDCLTAAVDPADEDAEVDCSSAPTCTRDASGHFALRCIGDLY